MIYFSKQWHTGTDRDTDPGDVVEDCDWEPPQYRPGWTVAYKTALGKRHVGTIRYVLRHSKESLDYYRVIRTKNNEPEIAFNTSIMEKIDAVN